MISIVFYLVCIILIFILLLLFFWMGKKQYIKTRHSRKAPQSTQEVYKGCLRAPQKNKRVKKTTPPQTKHNQSTNSTTEEGPTAKNPLAYAQRLQRK